MMGKTFEIISDPITYEIDRREIYGELYIKCGGIAFPYDDWGDLFFLTLDMWFDSLSQLRYSDEGQKTSFHFGDGPHYFDVERLSHGKARITFYNHEKLVGTSSDQVELDEIEQEIRRVTKQVLETAKPYKRLQFNIDRLKRLSGDAAKLSEPKPESKIKYKRAQKNLLKASANSPKGETPRR